MLSNEELGMHYEGMCIRPPSEAMSILLQVTTGCSHNRCTFCGSYKDNPFKIKPDELVLHDIRFAARTMKHQHRLFLMDGDALIIPQSRLLGILQQIRTHLPWVRRVGTYANTKAIRKKTAEQLSELKEHGLGILYLGVETGDDALLEEIRKGATADEYAELAQKVRTSGMKLSVTVLLGIAGRTRSLAHARATGALLSRMDPNYVGALTVMLIPGTPLHQAFHDGTFDLPGERELLLELREMIQHTHLSSGLFFSNHASNYLPIKARLPRGKQAALELIDAACAGNVALRPEWMRAL